MQIQVNVNDLSLIETEALNENEYDVHTLEFTFSEEYEGLTKVALFTANSTTYKVIITNDQCSIPAETLANEGCFTLGVYAFEVDGETLVQRFSPTPMQLYIQNGSYIADEDTENSEPLTPTDKEQILAMITTLQAEVAQIPINTQDIADIKEEQTTQNTNISTNANNIATNTSSINTINNKLNTIEEGAEVNIIEDVKVNGTSLEIENKSVNIEVPTKTSDLINDSGFITKEVNDLTNYMTTTQTTNAIGQETTLRENADINLQSQIDAITASSDVVDIVGTYQELVDYDTTHIKANDIIKVLQDSTHENAQTYYRWVITDHIGAWVYVGSEGPYYTKSESDTNFQAKISPTNKLNADLINDTTSTNKFVTNAEKTQITTNENDIAGIKNGTTIDSFEDVESALNEKQDTLTFDTTPTENSTNPVTSGGIYDSQEAQNTKIEILESIVSQLPQVEGEGTEITLNNTINAPFTEFNVIGRTTQEGNPTPENPIPIKNTGDNGSVNEKVQNKNWFDLSKRLLGTIDENGDLVINGTSRKFYEADFKENTQYTLSAYVKSPSGTVRFRTYYTDGTFNDLVLYNGTNEYQYKTFTTTVNKTLDYISMYYGNVGQMYIKNAELQIEQGSTATSYVPYAEQNISFPLAQGQKLMSGDYLADDGVHHVRGEVIFKGNETNFTKSNNYAGSYYIAWNNIDSNAKKNTPFLCSHAINVTDLSNYSVGKCYSDLTCNLWLGNATVFPNVDSFLQYLTQQYANGTPVKAQYELAEEVIDPYTTEQQIVYNQIKELYTYSEQTNISSTDTTPPYLEVKGLLDLNTLVGGA